MSEVKRFTRDSLIYLVGEGLSKSLAFILLPIYASYLSVEDFAVLSLISALWPAIVIFAGHGFSTFITRGYFEYEDRRRFLGTTLIYAMSFALVVSSIIHLIGPQLFALILKHVTYKPYLQYAVVFSVFRVYFIHIFAFYRAKREPKTVVTMSAVLFALNLLAVLTAIYVLDGHLAGILKAQAIAYFLVAVLFTIKIWPEFSLKFQAGIIVPAALFVLPLVPHAISGWAVAQIGRIFIERYMSLTEVSIYSIAVQLAFALSVMNNSLNQAWTPFVYDNYNRSGGADIISLSAKKMLLLTTLLGSALILFSTEILQFMGKSEYLEAGKIFPVLTIGYIFQIVYFIHVVVLICIKRPIFLPIISGIAGAVTISFNILLIPRYGMLGAALCQNIAFLLMAVLAIIFSRKYIKIKIFSRPVIQFLILSIALVGISFRFGSELDAGLRILVNLSILTGLVFTLVRLGLLNPSNVKALFKTTS